MTDTSKQHLRYAGQAPQVQAEALETFVRDTPLLMEVLAVLRDMQLNDSWVVAGALYNNVWNWLTGRPLMTGVKDIDVFYFDDTDLSYEAEDAVIKRGDTLFGHLDVPVEIRNQARVHLWYEDHFGQTRAPLTSCKESMSHFASKTHAIGARLTDDGRLDVYAPFGLDDIFSFRVVPNHVLDNRRGYENKAKRIGGVWPELEIIPW
jgi:hypothetical protein